MNTYTVRKSSVPVDISAAWDSEMWQNAEIAKIEYHFADRNQHGFVPEVALKMLHDGKRICGLFQVHDQYVIARKTADQQQVCQDSCVEFFVKPAGSERYFNFEINCGGTLLLYDIKNLFEKDFEQIPQAELDTVERFHTLPHIIENEITDPVTWYLGFAIPVEFFVNRTGVSAELSGQQWTANFTKCADHCSHPAWLSWQKLSRCAFHLPDEFGKLIFE